MTKSKSLFADYLSDDEPSTICSEEALIRKMLQFEMALAQVQGEEGILEASVAKSLADQLSQVTISPEELSEGTAQSGIPTIPFLAKVRAQLSDQTKDFLHFGATSQDVMDTAMVLAIKDAITLYENRLRNLLELLGNEIKRNGQFAMVGRTRGQQAVPITFGVKLSNWATPLIRDLERIEEIKPQILKCQFGGAAGTLAAFDEGMDVSKKLAEALELHSSLPWHTQREPFEEFAQWLGSLSLHLGKMGEDVLFMCQTEIGEIGFASGGNSSAMPHKNNPVDVEALIALSRQCQALSQSLINHQNERDGVGLILEWITLPDLMIKAGSAINHAIQLVSNWLISEQRMKANLNLTCGLVYSELAVKTLMDFHSPGRAKSLVREACQKTAETGNSLAESLTELTPDLSINWKETLTPANCLGTSHQITSETLFKIRLHTKQQ